jgi:hypothetical protein
MLAVGIFVLMWLGGIQESAASNIMFSLSQFNLITVILIKLFIDSEGFGEVE